MLNFNYYKKGKIRREYNRTLMLSFVIDFPSNGNEHQIDLN